MSTELQQKRAEMRLDFLKCLNYISNKEAEIKLFSGFQSSGTVLAWDRDIHHCVVKDLKTPTGVVRHSIVRVTDITSLSVEQNK